MRTIVAVLLLAALTLALTACGGAEPTATPSPPANVGSNTGVQISMTTDPAPPKSGNVLFTFTVMDAAGKPITDADSEVHIVSDMPTMRHAPIEGDATHVGDGQWQAQGKFSMRGEWRIMVTVTRNGELLATKDLRVEVRG